MKEKLKQWWSELSKPQKYCVIAICWVCNLGLYLMIPNDWYLLDLSSLMLSCVCGSATAAVQKGDL